MAKSHAAAAAAGGEDHELAKSHAAAAGEEAVVTQLLYIMDDLEELGVVLGIKEVASDRSLLNLVLRPNRPSTALRHIRMWRRYYSFIKLDMGTFPGHVFGAARVARWLKDFMDNNAGATTPMTALGMLRFMSHKLEFPEPVSITSPLYTLARRWKEEQAKERSQAPPFNKRFILLLENGVLDKVRCHVDRLAMGRMRVAVGASVRNDDLRRTPVARMELVLHPDGSMRGVKARAKRTKTHARLWVCSSLGIDSVNDGWLQQVIVLLREAHGTNYNTDDNMGKMCLSDRLGYDKGPPDGPTDAAHIRKLMREESRDVQGRVGFTEDEIAAFRVHSCKPTLISAGIHCNQKMGSADGTAAIRHQGGWRGKQDENMPDTYLRESQVLFMEFQERVLRFLRGGGSITPLITVPLQQDTDLPTQACATEASEASPDASSDSSSSEEEQPTGLGPLEVAILTVSTGRIHRAVSAEGSESLCVIVGMRPHCNRRVGAGEVIRDGLHKLLHARGTGTVACVCCFPWAGRPGECPMLCGAGVQGGFCPHRCISCNASDCVSRGHTCKVHSQVMDPPGTKFGIRGFLDLDPDVDLEKK